MTARINWANDLNENIEPFGGNVARSRGAVLESDDLMFALSHLWVGSAKMVNETRFQSANRDQTVNSLDPKCGGVCTLENQGGPTLEVLGVASVGRQRFTPQPRKNQRYQVLDTVSYFTGPHQFKAGFDFNYIDAAESEPSVALRRAVHLRQHSRGVRTAVRSAGRRGAGDRGRAAGTSGTLRAGLRRLGRAVYLQRLLALRAG